MRGRCEVWSRKRRAAKPSGAVMSTTSDRPWGASTSPTYEKRTSLDGVRSSRAARYRVRSPRISRSHISPRSVRDALSIPPRGNGPVTAGPIHAIEGGHEEKPGPAREPHGLGGLRAIKEQQLQVELTAGRRAAERERPAEGAGGGQAPDRLQAGLSTKSRAREGDHLAGARLAVVAARDGQGNAQEDGEETGKGAHGTLTSCPRLPRAILAARRGLPG